MEPEAEMVGAGAHDSEDEEAPLTVGGQRRAAEGRGAVSDDDDASPIASSGAPSRGSQEASSVPATCTRRLRLVIAASFLCLGVASYAAAHAGGAGAGSPARSPKVQALDPLAPVAGGAAPAEAPAQPSEEVAGATGTAATAPLAQGAPPRAEVPAEGEEEEDPFDLGDVGAAAVPDANSLGDQEEEPKGTASGKDGPSIFCFAWTTRRRHDEEMLPEAHRLMKLCNGALIFTDKDAPGEDVSGMVKVAIPRQTDIPPRSDEEWLRSRAMVGLVPAWSHLMALDVLEKHDWVFNLKLDMFMDANLVRLTLMSFLDTLRNGDKRERFSTRGPLMLTWGNAFLFNRRMVKEMKARWPKISRTADEGTPETGCPLFMKDLQGWPLYCFQEVGYPALVKKVMVVPSFGRAPCNAPGHTSGGQSFPVTCWDMNQNPLGESEEDQMEAVRTLASMRNLSGPAAAEERFRGTRVESHVAEFFAARKAPLIIGIASRRVLELASALLGR